MSLADRISAESRRKKFDQFLSMTSPRPGETIVDVGVNVQEYSEADNYLERHYPHPENITAIGLQDMEPFQARYPKVRAIKGDGRGLPFSDDEFDIAYSNAVIEHVGGRDDQRHFLRELLRVGKRGYLTTPNRLFPVEVHTRLPLLHILLPKAGFDAVLRALGKGWAAGNYMHLLSKKELRTLLEESGYSDFSIRDNRFFGLAMTFTVVWSKSSRH
ncbi:MAG TPA: methyltransferase domain-containing protein [Phenylobacterium sp.]